MSMEFVLGVMKMLWNGTVVAVAQSCEYTKTTELHTLKG